MAYRYMVDGSGLAALEISDIPGAVDIGYIPGYDITTIDFEEKEDLVSFAQNFDDEDGAIEYLTKRMKMRNKEGFVKR